jgi:hypothetical protein
MIRRMQNCGGWAPTSSQSTLQINTRDADVSALEKWHNRPLQVRVLDRCDECGELKEDVQKHVSLWPNITAFCCAKCFAEMTAEYSGFALYQ